MKRALVSTPIEFTSMQADHLAIPDGLQAKLPSVLQGTQMGHAAGGPI
jgi:hypothetical protein